MFFIGDIWSGRGGLSNRHRLYTARGRRQKMSYTGNYRMEINFDDSEVVHLFKAWNGTMLDVDLIHDHGFTVSDELRKRLLGEIKLADLTIGDLAGIASKKEDKLKEPEAGTLRRFPRRV